MAEHVRVLHDDAARFLVHRRGQRVQVRPGHMHRRHRHRMVGHPAERAGHVAVVRMQVAGQHRFPPPRHPGRHHHRLGAGGRAVIHGGVGHLHAGQHRHLALELEQHLQRALRNFRLVGRVGGQKLAPLDQIIHRRGHMVAVGTCPQKKRPAARRMVLGSQLLQRPLHRHFAGVRRQIQGRVQARFGGHIAEQFVHAVHTDRLQHRGAVAIRQG